MRACRQRIVALGGDRTAKTNKRAHLQRAQHAVELLHVRLAALGLAELQVLRAHAGERDARVALEAARLQAPRRHLARKVAIRKQAARLHATELLPLSPHSAEQPATRFGQS